MAAVFFGIFAYKALTPYSLTEAIFARVPVPRRHALFMVALNIWKRESLGSSANHALSEIDFFAMRLIM